MLVSISVHTDFFFLHLTVLLFQNKHALDGLCPFRSRLYLYSALKTQIKSFKELLKNTSLDLAFVYSIYYCVFIHKIMLWMNT